ncbi:UNVERIFIED_CONTAM: hypothetical protein K2H54_016377 [Gekko kuhli]
MEISQFNKKIDLLAQGKLLTKLKLDKKANSNKLIKPNLKKPITIFEKILWEPEGKKGLISLVYKQLLDLKTNKTPVYQDELRPRLCQMKKGPNGYGFNLHSDKTKPGQYVRAVDPDSPAESSGLRPQDRIIEVEIVEYFKGLRAKAFSWILPTQQNAQYFMDWIGSIQYCFCLHGPSNIRISFIWQRDTLGCCGIYLKTKTFPSPAAVCSGASVNGVTMEGKQHSDVVAAIRAGGDETKLLVVDSLADEFFKKCKVLPSEEHLTGEEALVARVW